MVINANSDFTCAFKCCPDWREYVVSKIFLRYITEFSLLIPLRKHFTLSIAELCERSHLSMVVCSGCGGDEEPHSPRKEAAL